MITTAIALGVLGMCFGSFVNALIWRTRQNELRAKSRELRAGKKLRTKDYGLGTKSRQLSIWSGRSVCPNCGHELAAKDLIPVISWLMLKGRCRYCKKPISKQYPIVELTMAAVFGLSYLLWPQDLSEAGQWFLFVSWLAASVGLLALAVYDLRWMLLPNKLVYPTLTVAAAGRAAYIIGYESDKWSALLNWAGAIIIASGLFYLIYNLSDKYIGGGDITLGLVTGTVLATPFKAVLMIFFASILGLLFALPGLISQSKKLTSKIPYGPFLITATFIVLLFGQAITDWYTKLLA